MRTNPNPNPTDLLSYVQRCSDFDALIGYYAPCSHPRVSNHMTLLAESFSVVPEAPRGNRNRCPVPGVLLNTNTLPSFRTLDRESLLQKEAKKVH